MKYFVYLTTNLITDKKYIGSHKGELDDSYIGSGTILLKSILKHGKRNFKRDILEIVQTRKLAFLLEEKWIKKMNTLIPIGYNVSPTGGMGNWGGEHSDESRKLMSEKRKGKKAWNRGLKTPYSDETLAKMRKTQSIKNSGKGNPMYGRTGVNSPIYGIKKTKEHCQKISIAKMGSKNPNSSSYKIETTDGKIIIVHSAADFPRKYPEYKKSRNFIYMVEKGQKVEGWKIKKL